MLSARQIQDSVGIVLLVGTILSACLVLSGGLLYLVENGGQRVDLTAMQTQVYHIHVLPFLENFRLSASALIELGLILLVATQILRVMLLALSYSLIRDYKFALISLFILLVLIYSFLLQK